MGDASQGSPGGQSMYTGASAQAVTTNFQRSQDTLYALAGDTGGKAFLDNNDLPRGIVQAQESISDYYLIGYYTTNTDPNGKFRRIRISLANNQEAKLDYRQGYYANKEFAKFNDVDRERQLEDALMLEDPITDLTIAMEIDYFQLNRAEYFVPIIVKIPGRELALAKRGGAEITRIDFVGEIKDLVGGTTVSNVRDNTSIKLSDETAAELARVPLEYDTGFTLLPGKYSIKFLARDDETGTNRHLPDDLRHSQPEQGAQAHSHERRGASSQRVDLREAIYDAAKAKDRAKDEAVNPLMQNGKKLIPSVTRVFSTGHQIHVYFQAYKQPAMATRTRRPHQTRNRSSHSSASIRAARNCMRRRRNLIVPSAASRLGTMGLNFDLGVDSLPRGSYDCQVTVIDPSTQKAAFWRASILLVQ